MSDCSKCVHKKDRCFCPPGRQCTAFQREIQKVKHTFQFETDDDWVPYSPGCWIDCPFSFTIGLGETCRCFTTDLDCPFDDDEKCK